MMTDDQRVFSNRPTPPGALLVRELDFRGIALPEFAAAIGQPLAVVRAQADGEQPLAPELAADLERALGIPAQLWLNLEDKYRATLARLAGNQPGQGDSADQPAKVDIAAD